MPAVDLVDRHQSQRQTAQWHHRRTTEVSSQHVLSSEQFHNGNAVSQWVLFHASILSRLISFCMHPRRLSCLHSFQRASAFHSTRTSLSPLPNYSTRDVHNAYDPVLVSIWPCPNTGSTRLYFRWPSSRTAAPNVNSQPSVGRRPCDSNCVHVWSK